MKRKLSCGGHKGLVRKQWMRGIWTSMLLAFYVYMYVFIYACMFESSLNFCVGAFSSGISISPITQEHIFTYKSLSYHGKANC